jgi:hypothetical protein
MKLAKLDGVALKMDFLIDGTWCERPMSYSSTGTSSSHNNGMDGEVVGLRPIECMRNSSIKK